MCLTRCNGSCVACIKENINLNLQSPTFIFLGFHENGFIKSCPLLEFLPAYKLPWTHVDWCKFCIDPRYPNISHFVMIEATRLKSMAARSPPINSITSILDSMKLVCWLRSNEGLTEWWSHKPNFHVWGNSLKTVAVNDATRMDWSLAT
jgi:hypothetical protein